MSVIKRALISVSNKTDIEEFAKALRLMDVQILSTGGTANALRNAGISVMDVSEYTGFPEMLEGRVKTLHPKIHGGLLCRRDNPEDMEEIKKHRIDTIDMVVVNLYPFEETVSKPGVTLAEAIENIDIGGPTMLRSASKNFRDVAVIVDPSDYKKIIREMRKLRGALSYKTRLGLAKKVFRRTSQYDKAITSYLSNVVKESSDERQQ